MTKNPEFQKELLENVTEGVKPSDLKKLKRSKSADDIVSPSTPNIPLKKSQSQLEIPTAQQPSSEEQITQLKEQVKFHAETAQNYLQSLQTSQAKITELEEKEKKDQQKVEELKDHILELRLENIQDFGKYRENLKEVEKEIQEAANELVEFDQKKINLQVQNKQLLGEKKDLENRLKSANQRIQELYQLKGLPNSVNNTNSDSFWSDYRFLLISLLTYWLVIWLLSKNSKKQ